MKSLLAALVAALAGLVVASPASAQQYYAFTQNWGWEYGINNPTRIAANLRYVHSETYSPSWSNLPGWNPAVQTKYQVRTATFTYAQLHDWNALLLETEHWNRSYWDDHTEIFAYAFTFGGGYFATPTISGFSTVQKLSVGKVKIAEVKGKDIPIPGVPGVTVTPSFSVTIKPSGTLRRGVGLVAVQAGLSGDAQLSLKAGPGLTGAKIGISGSLSFFKPTISVETELQGVRGTLSAEAKIQPLVGKLAAFVELGLFTWEYVIFQGGFNIPEKTYPIFARGFHSMSPVTD